MMSMAPVDLTGGDSVYCINQSQLQTAMDMKHNNEKVKDIVFSLEEKLSHNERAAVAFLLIDNLIQSP